MGMYSAGLVAFSPKVIKTQLLESTIPSGLIKRGIVNDYHVYEIPECKWYGRGETFEAYFRTHSPEDCIALVAYEEGGLSFEQGDPSIVSFEYMETEGEATYFYITSPVGKSAEV